MNEQILNRLHELYQQLPIEYCGYALSAIEDIEEIMARYKNENSSL